MSGSDRFDFPDHRLPRSSCLAGLVIGIAVVLALLAIVAAVLFGQYTAERLLLGERPGWKRIGIDLLSEGFGLCPRAGV